MDKELMRVTARLFEAQKELKRVVYGNYPKIDSDEVLTAAQNCRSYDNMRNRVIARLIRKRDPLQ